MCLWVQNLFNVRHFHCVPPQVDEFTVTCIDLGKLQKVTLGHDLVGRGQGWYCEEVVVKVAELEENVFPCKTTFYKKGIVLRCKILILSPCSTHI